MSGMVALLRGVNVGGHRRFQPSVLARELEHLDVTSIGAAGTFVVRKRMPARDVQREFAARLPFETEIMVCRGSDVRELIAAKPFGELADDKSVVQFVGLLAKPSAAAKELPDQLPIKGPWLLQVLQRNGPFVVGVHRREMKALGTIAQLEKLLGTSMTARSWNTIVKVAAVLDRT